MPSSGLVTGMTIILNVMLRLGVSKTDITHKLVLCRPLLTDSVRTASLITNNVKKTGRAPAVKPDMSTPVLRGGCMLLQTVASGTVPTASAVPLRPRPDVRPAMP